MSAKTPTIQERILDFANLFGRILTTSNKISDEDKSLFEEIYQEIITELLYTPGMLLYYENTEDQKNAQALINYIYETLETNEMFDEITNGGYSGLLVNIISDYLKRAKLLKPAFISINPKNYEFKKYFVEAMRAWLYGADNAALILCASIIEDILKSELERIDINLAYRLKKKKDEIVEVRSVGLIKLIKNALDKNILDLNHYEKAIKIAELRHDAVHELKYPKYNEIYDSITNTKTIIENLLTRES